MLLLSFIGNYTMFKGISFALAACFIWGFIFIAPQMMAGFNPLEITLGRYSFYGIISAAIFCRSWFQGMRIPSGAIWKKAFLFSFMSTIAYYPAIVAASRYSTPAICALVLGVSPITIAFYGNWKRKEIAFSHLLLPSLLICLGLVMINWPHMTTAVDSSTYILGLCCGFLALSLWSWYVVANSKFLKDHPEISSNDWSTLMGVATLFWVVVVTLFWGVFFQGVLHYEKFCTFDASLMNFILGCGFLGIFCSWVGGFCWNRASFYLPVSLAGQLTIFETIFGVIFVYLFERQLPPLTESGGIAILLIAIVYGIQQFMPKQFASV